MTNRTATFLRTELPIYSISFNSAIHFVLSVSMSGLVRAFPGTKESALMYLLTISTISGIAGGFLFSVLAGRFSKKNLSVAALAFGCACALLFLLFPTQLPLLFFAAAGQGIVSGFIATAFPLLVSAHVEEARRSKVIGIGSGVIQFGRLATLLLGGFLANIRWNRVYFVYMFMAAALLLTVFLLPQDTPAKRSGADGVGDDGADGVGGDGADDDGADGAVVGDPGGDGHDYDAGDPGGEGAGLVGRLIRNKGVWQLMAVSTIFGVAQFLSQSHVSLYIEGYGLGQPSTTGTLTAISCGLAGITGLFFASILRLTGKRTFIAAYLLLGAGFICAGSFVSLPSIFLGLAFCMAAMAIFIPYSLLCAGRVSDPETAPFVMAVMPACMNLGSFLSPAIINSLSSVFGDGSPAAAYLVGGVYALVGALIMFALSRRLVFED